MKTHEIHPGDYVRVRTADEKTLAKRALSGVVDGADFPVVWVCALDEYEVAHTVGRAQRWQPRVREYPPGIPWPHEDVERSPAPPEVSP